MTGKEKCQYLKEIRASVAQAYKIEGFEYKECPFTGNCLGTCPACDAEAQLLYDKLKSLGMDIDAEALKEVEQELFPKKTIDPIPIEPIPDTPGVMWIPDDNKEKTNPEYNADMIKGKIVKEPPKSIWKKLLTQDNHMLGDVDADYFDKTTKKDNPEKMPRGLRGFFKKKK